MNKYYGSVLLRPKLDTSWSSLGDLILEMGASSSTSLSKLQENNILQKFVGPNRISKEDEFWDQLLSFSYASPTDSVYVKL